MRSLRTEMQSLRTDRCPKLFFPAEPMMNLFDKFPLGLSYVDFLTRFANDGQKLRWRQMHEQVRLTAPQRELLAGFRRRMNVLCLAGAWCGDCINQCPIFDHFATVTPTIHVRYLDRDEHADA